ncbi:MAG TPA: hypothetical protein VM577_06790 [Anaerovoracaceae bacterium]|nr:hypothetical protein [Anaerovoracaceae bacterium]
MKTPAAGAPAPVCHRPVHPRHPHRPLRGGRGKNVLQVVLGYNILGGVAWVSLFFGIGYFFGNIGYIKDHFSLVVAAIAFISVVPAVVAALKDRAKKRDA